MPDLTTNQLALLALGWTILQWWLQRRDARSKLATSEAEAKDAVAKLTTAIELKNHECGAERGYRERIADELIREREASTRKDQRIDLLEKRLERQAIYIEALRAEIRAG